jgi:flagellar assembly factor FliW
VSTTETALDMPVVEFPEGLPGFPDLTRYVLVRLDDAGLVLDLQSVQDPDVRFVVVPSVAFFPDYAPTIDDRSVSLLGLSDTSAALVLVIVTVGRTIAESTVNLMAPIVLNPESQVAVQIVLDDPNLPLHAPLSA